MTDQTVTEPVSEALITSDHMLVRAGSPAQQGVWNAAAWSLLEEYQTPSGLPGTRISNDVMGSRDWRAQLVPFWRLRNMDRELLTSLPAACRALGIATLFGTAVNPRAARPSAVWKLELEPVGEPVGLFFNLHFFNFHMAFDEGGRCAIHANDGDHAVYVGPETFIRNALLPIAIGRAATEAVREDAEEFHGPGFIDSILEHYAPFMLDDD